MTVRIGGSATKTGFNYRFTNKKNESLSAIFNSETYMIDLSFNDKETSVYYADPDFNTETFDKIDPEQSFSQSDRKSVLGFVQFACDKAFE